MTAKNLILSNSLRNGTSQQHAASILTEWRHSPAGERRQTALHKVNELPRCRNMDCGGGLQKVVHHC